MEWKIFQGCFKNKNEKRHMKRLSFTTQFKIEILLLFTSYRKVLRKMPATSHFWLETLWLSGGSQSPDCCSSCNILGKIGKGEMVGDRAMVTEEEGMLFALSLSVGKYWCS